MSKLTIDRVRELAKVPGELGGDRPVFFLTATEVRQMAQAWLLLDEPPVPAAEPPRCDTPGCSFHAPLCERHQQEHMRALRNGMPPSGRYA